MAKYLIVNNFFFGKYHESHQRIHTSDSLCVYLFCFVLNCEYLDAPDVTGEGGPIVES